jgi:hypothetical protein
MLGTTIGSLSNNQAYQPDFNTQQIPNGYDNLRNIQSFDQNNFQPQLINYPNNNNNDYNDILDIQDLAKDINNNFRKDTFDTVAENKENNKDDESLHLFGDMSSNLRDPIIIFILYIILSQSSVIGFFGKYIKQLNPDDDGKFSFAAVVIYGIILVGLFIIIRKFIV